MSPMGRVIVTAEELSDVRLALAGRSGHFSSSQLYGWYVEAMRREGREPAHAVRFGQMLAEYGALRRPIWDKNKPARTASGKAKRPGQTVKGWLV